jgi:hypothetical protein
MRSYRSYGKVTRLWPLLAVIISFTAIGTVLIATSKASTFVVFNEAENGVHASPAIKTVDSAASGGSAIKFTSDTTSNCTISTKLVPSCGAWLGAWSNDHGVSGLRNQIQEHEARIGRTVHAPHSYHPAGNTNLSADEKYFISRPNTFLHANWKPASVWRNAGGNNATVNASIDTMADSIKSVAPKKILLTIFHEPENDVSGGAASCPSTTYKGNTGTPAEYRAMWQNTRNRFDAKEVTNVVWVMNYMGFSNFDCMAKDLWPGNNLVDWVMYDPYPGGNETWNTGIGRFYNWLNANSDATHAFSSKPYGLGEWGSWHKTQPAVYTLYDAGRAALVANTYPNIKLYSIFDAIGIDDSRTNTNDAEQPDTIEQQHYNNFATAPQLNQPFSQ